MLRWHFSMRYILVCIAEISGNSSNTESKAKCSKDWYGNEPTVSYKYFSRFRKPSVLNPNLNSIGNKLHISWHSHGFGWFQSWWLLSCKLTSPHLSVMHCSDGSKSLTVNSIADHTDCVIWGVGDNVSHLPWSAVWAPTASGTTWSPVTLSSVMSPSCIGTATLVLGLWGELGGTCGVDLWATVFLVPHSVVSPLYSKCQVNCLSHLKEY